MIVGLTNVAFEREPSTTIEHPSGKRLHEVADIVIDIGGPTGDGVFEVEELSLRAIPHSGVTLVAALWMIFSSAMEGLRDIASVPRLYQCDMVEGSRPRNADQLSAYSRTGVGYVPRDELDQIRTAQQSQERC